MKRKNRLVEAHAFGPLIFSSDEKGCIDIAIRLENTEVVDYIISGKSRGLSAVIVTREFVCSICGKSYEKCPHEVNKQYGNETCAAIAKKPEFGSPSIVDNPADRRCRIIDLLIIRDINGRRVLEWYGFRPNSDLDHSKHIQKALESGLIPEKAAFRFNAFFSINLEGRCCFP